jgi:hypothetical protein
MCYTVLKVKKSITLGVYMSHHKFKILQKCKLSHCTLEMVCISPDFLLILQVHHIYHLAAGAHTTPKLWPISLCGKKRDVTLTYHRAQSIKQFQGSMDDQCLASHNC